MPVLEQSGTMGETFKMVGADHVVADQSEVAAFLATPATHGAGIHRVERIDTHGATVFLAGQRAYKLKRAVRFPYMDFSTLALRRAACEREVELNRRTAPELYLGVEAVVRGADGKLAFGGPGEPVEWLVVMTRFDQGGLCDHLARAGRLTPGLMAALADEIAVFHDGAERLDAAVAPGGGAAGLGAVIEDNLSEVTAGSEVLLPGELEQQTKARRLAEGVDISDESWQKIAEAARAVGVTV